MIDFQPIIPEMHSTYAPCLEQAAMRGCEYSFVNHFLWGQQKAAIVENCLVVFAQYGRSSVYLYPVGQGDKKKALDAVLEDAAQRGINCRLAGMTDAEKQELQQLYPDVFCYHCDRDDFDYVYSIEDLAQLRGRKFQKKRNHLNRFFENHPAAAFVPITEENLPRVEQLCRQWFDQRLAEDPYADLRMEQIALMKALHRWEELPLEGLLLLIEDQPVAMCLGSRVSGEMFDIHFEKALDGFDGAYAAINNAFAKYLQEKYPEVRYLNREDDLGLPGLRKAKLSYCPELLIEKYWAHVRENGYED